MRVKTIIKKSAELLLFLAGFILIWYGLRYVLINDSQSLTRLTFHDLYKQKSIDALFVGSSHCDRSIDPAVMDSELGLNTFNAGTSGQTLDGSFAVIQEAVKNCPIQHIYLELYYGIGVNSTRHNQKELTQTYIIFDYIKPGISKYHYLLQAANSTQYIHSFFPMRRNWKSLYSLDRIQSHISVRRSENYKNFVSINGYETKGFTPAQQEIAEWNYFPLSRYFTPIDIQTFTDDWKEDLQNIIRFCEKEQIELTIFSAPIPDPFLINSGNYDDYITMVRDMLRGTDISYYDFNLCKEVYYPCDSSLFSDDHHLSKKGAELFSLLFSRFIRGDVSPNELFYNSYAEKLQHMKPTVFYIDYQVKNGEGGVTYRRCHIVSTPTENMEYQITIRPEEGEPYLIQDYGWNKIFPLKEDGAGQIIIRWRVKGHPEYSGERIIDFQHKKSSEKRAQ